MDCGWLSFPGREVGVDGTARWGCVAVLTLTLRWFSLPGHVGVDSEGMGLGCAMIPLRILSLTDPFTPMCLMIDISSPCLNVTICLRM